MRSAVDVESEHTYVVKSGDTLSRIAERELGDANLWSKITRQDGSTFSEADAATLRIGQVVILPGKGQHTSKSPATSDGFASLVSRSFYDNRFSNRNLIYTYDALLKAVDRFPQFCREGSDADHKREAAAFLAHIAHESGELKFVEEISPPTMYRDESNTTFPPAPGRSYHGRGPIQLSWNYNYGLAGKAVGLDLLSDPDLVKNDGSVAWMTALWFWMTPQTPKLSCHAVMSGTWVPTDGDRAANRLPGFGMTTFIINGDLECGKPNQEQVNRRVKFYRDFCEILQVDPGQNLFCDKMKSGD